MNVGIAIQNTARRSPDAAAVIENGRTLTYAQLDARSNRLADVLAGTFGVERGDRVALLTPNRTAIVEVLAACAKLGAVYCGLNFRLGEEEYDAILENAAARVIVCGDEHRELAARLGTRHGAALRRQATFRQQLSDGARTRLLPLPSKFKHSAARYCRCAERPSSRCGKSTPMRCRSTSRPARRLDSERRDRRG